jgi:hypothetical protein
MGIIAGAAILGAASIGGGLLAAGSKPKVPAFKPIDFQAEQKQAIQQNIEALQPATELAQKTTAAEQSQLEAQLRRAIPGYDQIVQQASKNIGSALKGELPTDVASQIQRSTAGRALSGGFGGASGFGRALTARDLGLTSLQLQNQGLAQAQNFIQQQRVYGMTQPFSVSSMFITPAQRVTALQNQQAAQYNRDMTAAQVAAMPDPKMAAIGQGIQSMGGVIGGSMFQGGMAGGMGRGGGYRAGSYNPQNDPEVYALPPTNIGGPTDYSNWA